MYSSHKSDNFIFFFCMTFSVTEIINPIIAMIRNIVRGTTAAVQDCPLSLLLLLLLTAALDHYFALLTYHVHLCVLVYIHMISS